MSKRTKLAIILHPSDGQEEDEGMQNTVIEALKW